MFHMWPGNFAFYDSWYHMQFLAASHQLPSDPQPVCTMTENHIKKSHPCGEHMCEHTATLKVTVARICTTAKGMQSSLSTAVLCMAPQQKEGWSRENMNCDDLPNSFLGLLWSLRTGYTHNQLLFPRRTHQVMKVWMDGGTGTFQGLQPASLHVSEEFCNK